MLTNPHGLVSIYYCLFFGYFNDVTYHVIA